ncbi:MAG: bacillithiol biosynthesis BshC [Candidatus Eisenbacteria bacterium]|nr:bacillithiol biosynthesis BshC [Candidatus Eisenbacteria bacterium]
MRAAGRPTIAAFWCVGDDTDHDEVSSSSWPLENGAVRRVRDEVPAEGRRIGGLEVARMLPSRAQLGADWPDSRGGPEALDDDLRRLGNGGWSGFLRAALLHLASGEPLLFVDGNDPAVIEASQPLLRRFAPERRALASEIESVARGWSAPGASPPLSGEEALRSLYLLAGSGRSILDPDTQPPRGGTLLPNVVLRPALQEHLLPVARVVCGGAEIAYRSLLGPVYARAGMESAPLMPRFAATFFPPAWSSGAKAPDPRLALEDPAGALDRWAWEGLEPGLAERVRDLRETTRGRLDDLRGSLAPIDASLVQTIESVGAKIDFQVGRLEEALHAKARLLLRRSHPGLADLREFLIPRGKPQERSFTLWTPFLWEGPEAAVQLREAVAAWFDRGERGHALLALNDRGASS